MPTAAMEVDCPYISAGGNRHPAAADWDLSSGLVAFGSGRNIALWNPSDEDSQGTYCLLSGHEAEVNVVKFLPQGAEEVIVILSGSVDQTIRMWQSQTSKHPSFAPLRILKGHSSSINCIAVAPASLFFASGAADATVIIWKVTKISHAIDAVICATISLAPCFFPLALAIGPLGPSASFALAVGGTKNIIQVYTLGGSEAEPRCKLQATLTGHESWIRSLAFATEGRNEPDGDLLLASASQDKYIRLWRVHRGTALPAAPQRDDLVGTFGKALSNKVHRLKVEGQEYSLTFEALLLGHDDWIFTLSWNSSRDRLRLLSASADNSVSIWQPESSSGIWLPTARLGEISSQKGSTTATGSVGGFWIGLWSGDGRALISLGRTGSWRRWSFDQQQNKWVQALGVSGHVKDVRGLAWAKDGLYLLSTSADQTTRLHAEWKREAKRSWHEFARPQIHGYDLNCVDTLDQARFVSGADEKLLRVFDEPAAVASMLEKLSDIPTPSHHELPNTASMPMLGLSNKAIDAPAKEEEQIIDDGTEPPKTHSTLATSTFSEEHPPFEDILARRTLWPEKEKLYGHGYEISALATSHSGLLIATACKASSIDHAVIRIYETKDWREVKPPLMHHSLTITCLRFAEDDLHLLSGSRDRGWARFSQKAKGSSTYELDISNPKGHSRMILGVAWAPSSIGRVFATAGRDKVIKIWGSTESKEYNLSSTLTQKAAVTSVDFCKIVQGSRVTFAAGNESGEITIYTLDSRTLALHSSQTIPKIYWPSLPVNQVAWRPQVAARSVESARDTERAASQKHQLAIASEDGSLRILTVGLSPQ